MWGGGGPDAGRHTASGEGGPQRAVGFGQHGRDNHGLELKQETRGGGGANVWAPSIVPCGTGH
jgi:hypothetical protein